MSEQNEEIIPTEKKNEGIMRAPTSFGSRGIVISNFSELSQFAKVVADSGLAPKGMDKPQAVFVAMQMGMELGLTPMAALQNVSVVNNRPALWGDAVLAVCRGSGEMEEFKEWYEVGGVPTVRSPQTFTDDVTAVCRVKRKGGDVMEVGFSVADAKRASLWSKAGPWTQYPARMLRYRARGFALRDAFGDALRGFRSAEEVQDDPIRDVTPTSTTEQPTFTRKKKALPEPAPVTEQPFEQSQPEPVETTVQESPEQEPIAQQPENETQPEETGTSWQRLKARLKRDNIEFTKFSAWIVQSGIYKSKTPPAKVDDMSETAVNACLSDWATVMDAMNG